MPKPTKPTKPKSANPADVTDVDIANEARRRGIEIRSLRSLQREDERIILAFLAGRMCARTHGLSLNDVSNALSHLHGDDDVPF
jgi:hypothetical protein